MNAKDCVGVLEEILAVLKAKPVYVATHDLRKDEAVFQGMTLAELRFSQYRMEPLKDGWFRDRFLTTYYGKNREWSPEFLEKKLQWQDGEKYAAQYGGQPEDFDLESLLDRSKRGPALVPGAAALNMKTDDWYWTSRKLANNEGLAWVVGPEGGGVDGCNEDYSNYVRPVRSSQ